MKYVVKIKKAFFILCFLFISFSFYSCSVKTYTVRYETDGNGLINGKEVYTWTVYSKDSLIMVTAKANEGYRFVKWSDNDSTEATRTDTNITSDITITAIFTKLDYVVTYNTDENGTINGEMVQPVLYDEDTHTVTAIPNEGYRFVKWSDNNSTNPIRTDVNVKKNITTTAIFEKIINTYTFIYNNATENTLIENVEIGYETLEEVSFPVPIKEYFTFDGWYLDAEFSKQVANEEGRLTTSYEMFESDSRSLYAKWIVNEELEFKILMVYVSEVYANLKTTDGTMFEVSYKMSELEKEVCKLITLQMTKYINEMFDGLVKFTIDEYFTTIPLTKDNIFHGVFRPNAETEIDCYNIFAENIPEVSGMLDNYGTTIVTFSMNDYEGLLDIGSGSGNYKSAAIHLERLCSSGVPLETYLDTSYEEWDGTMGTYIHELTHTIEQGLSVYNFHLALVECQKQELLELESYKLYLLNQLIIDGENVGIPYPFWKNEVYTMTYNAQRGKYGEMGYVGGDILPNGMPQRVCKGYDALSVTAIAGTGHVFIGWSDGVMTATRTDRNIQSDFTVTAYFKPIIYDVNYLAGEGGIIEGKANQKIEYMERTEAVVAVANSGYVFVGWSDGYQSAERYDFINVLKLGLTVTAIFEPID